MARMGGFSRGSVGYGLPLSFVKPRDNNYQANRWAPELLDPALNLTDAQRQELQDRIDELYNVYRGERDYPFS